MTKLYKRRKLHNLESPLPGFAPLGSLSHLLAMNNGNKLFLCGRLEDMTREYMMEPLSNGWEIEGEFAFKHRTAVYYNRTPPTKRVTVKLVSHRESWFPGCEDAVTAFQSWQVLEAEWPKNLPLLSSPAATGKALLWETLPCDKDGNAIEFPALPDELAKLIRANSPQHRIEKFVNLEEEEVIENCGGDETLYQYDGRWMYASLCGLDRLPIGAPRRAEGFTPYAPGVYDVTVRVPQDWNHVGLIPWLRDAMGGRVWAYPNEPGACFRSWAFEPELTFAIEGVKKLGLPAWEIFDFHDGYTFEKGRPLALWSAKLIETRATLQHGEAMAKYVNEEWESFHYASAAIRQILNHTIGSIHKNEFEREEFVSDDNFRRWRREHPDLAESERYGAEKVEGGWLVPSFVPDTSRLSIFMPHWSSTLYSLARARVAEWALRCDPSTLVKIHGDAIYSTIEQSELDKLDDGKTLGRPRRK